jgi:hypothetical protein
MIDYVYGRDDEVADFVAQLIPHCRRGFGPRIKAIGVIDGGALIYGVVYHNWNPESAIMEMSGAALPQKPWLTRETLRRIYHYPFVQCQCQMIIMNVPADNTRLLGQLGALDYSFAAIARLYGRNRDGVVCTLTSEAWDNNRINQRLKREPHSQTRKAA